MLDVFRHAPFARPHFVAELPGCMRERPIPIGKQGNSLEPRLKLGLLADNITRLPSEMVEKGGSVPFEQGSVLQANSTFAMMTAAVRPIRYF
jgi:hypothetical protein